MCGKVTLLKFINSKINGTKLRYEVVSYRRISQGHEALIIFVVTNFIVEIHLYLFKFVYILASLGKRPEVVGKIN